MTKSILKSAIISALALGLLQPAGAVTIGTLFNTGVDGSATVLPDATIGDPHYTLVSTPGGTSAIRIRSSVGGFPIPPYLGDNTLSRWIGPNNSPALDGPVGSYTYRTTFDLTGLNSLTASISGGWSSDNDGVAIWLNGVGTGTQVAGFTSFTQFSEGFVAFSVASGFVAGINTLDFIINNGGGPTALRVEMSGTAQSVAQVPDGGMTLALLGLGLTGMATLHRKLAV